MALAGLVAGSCSPDGFESENWQKPVSVKDKTTATPSPPSMDKKSIPVAFTITPEPSSSPEQVPTFKSIAAAKILATETQIPPPSSTLFPTETVAATATSTNTAVPTRTSTPTLDPIPLPILAFEITPYPEIPAEEKWIEVDLSDQYLVAYERSFPVWVVKVSTGLPLTPTKAGEFRIYSKLEATTMTGSGYVTPDVPWTMYYDQLGYAIHGAYWHDNFGQTMSHGCVNLPVDQAEWLFKWVPDLEEGKEGTLVIIHE